MQHEFDVLAHYAMDTFLETFELPANGKNNDLIGVRGKHRKYILKRHTSATYATADSIHYEARLLQYLAASDLPFAVPLLLRNRSGDIITETSRGIFSLTPFFDGRRLNAKSGHDVMLLGAAVGQLQTVLARHPAEKCDKPAGRALFTALLDFSAPHINPLMLTPSGIGLSAWDADLDDLFAWWRHHMAQVQTFVEQVYPQLPHQICHNDITPHNVLVENGQIVAILDFEFMTVAARALDVAMVLRMTMRTWENPQPIETAQHFFEGYQRWITLTDAEMSALPMLINLRAALPIIWWLGRQQAYDTIPTLMTYYRNLTRWFADNERLFLEQARA